MTHDLIDLILRASREGWCVRWGCTTCGARDFRRALRDLPPDPVSVLARTDLGVLQQTDGWRDCTLIAIWSLRDGERSAALKAWLPNLRSNPRFADLVLFYVVRNMTVEPAVASDWVRACEGIAREAEDVSLVESLVYTLGDKLDEHPNTLALAERMAMTQPPVWDALDQVGYPPPSNPDHR